jgi:predicted RNA-binding Zn-ribbon protein involved in translation (DUF1610 family)
MTSASFEDESPTCSRCGYFTHETTRTVPKVQCPECGREVLDVTDSLSRISIPSTVLGSIPESVARECCIVPFNDDHGGLVVLIDLTKTSDTETVDKLRFILNRRITCLHADATAIQRAIERDYGGGD